MLSGQIADAGGPLGPLFARMADNLGAALRAEALAERAGMSPRTFVARTGVTPAKAIEALRVQAARGSVERGPAPLGGIAVRCGFGDEQRMRRALLRQLRATPSDLRTVTDVAAATASASRERNAWPQVPARPPSTGCRS